MALRIYLLVFLLGIISAQHETTTATSNNQIFDLLCANCKLTLNATSSITSLVGNIAIARLRDLQLTCLPFPDMIRNPCELYYNFIMNTINAYVSGLAHFRICQNTICQMTGRSGIEANDLSLQIDNEEYFDCDFCKSMVTVSLKQLGVEVLLESAISYAIDFCNNADDLKAQECKAIVNEIAKKVQEMTPESLCIQSNMCEASLTIET